MTGGFRPVLRFAGRPCGRRVSSPYLVQTHTYRSALAVDESLVKTHPTDTDKIATIIQLVGGSVDVGAYLPASSRNAARH